MGCAIVSGAHAGPHQGFDMHGPERLHGFVAGACGQRAVTQAPTLPAFLAKQFIALFQGFFIDQVLHPARKSLLVEAVLVAVFSSRQTTLPPRLDMHRSK